MKINQYIVITAGIIIFATGCAYYAQSGGKVEVVTGGGARVCVESSDTIQVNDELNVYRKVRENYSSKAQTTSRGETRLLVGRIRVIEILDSNHFCAKLLSGIVEEGFTVDK